MRHFVSLCFYNMDIALLQRELVRFRTRADRPAYIGRRFDAYLQGRILDVGCDEAVLRNLVGPKRYTGVGLTAESDVKADLEHCARLPFEDAAWDTVLCLDTLEHLNNLHSICGELFRIAARYVIISLPNCWCQARRSLASGSGNIWQYGLSQEAPADRHKWFFNTEQACDFLAAQSHRKDPQVEILEFVALENRRPLINRFWRRLKYPSRRKYLNLYPHTVVCVFGIYRNAGGQT